MLCQNIKVVIISRERKKTNTTKRNLFVFTATNFNSFAFRSFTRVVCWSHIHEKFHCYRGQGSCRRTTMADRTITSHSMENGVCLKFNHGAECEGSPCLWVLLNSVCLCRVHNYFQIVDSKSRMAPLTVQHFVIKLWEKTNSLARRGPRTILTGKFHKACR